MLREKFYTCLSVENSTENSREVRIKLNDKHPVFEGHFPAVPVVPGVCMMQIVKEQLEDHLKQKLSLKHAAVLKFMAVINPLEVPELTVKIDFVSGQDGIIISEGSISSGEKSFFKISKAAYF
jgi:3-hydroxyacyl-[acyl-carrier-protein] dehydratase